MHIGMARRTVVKPVPLCRTYIVRLFEVARPDERQRRPRPMTSLQIKARSEDEARVAARKQLRGVGRSVVSLTSVQTGADLVAHVEPIATAPAVRHKR